MAVVLQFPKKWNIWATKSKCEILSIGTIFVFLARMAPTQDINASRGQKPPPWMKSRAKELLEKLIADESSYIHADGMDVDQIYISDPLFKQYKIENFRTNYRNLVAKIDLERYAVEFDQQAYNKEIEKFVRNDRTKRGYKFWDGDEAQRLMKEDAKHKRTEGLKPQDLWESREAYKAFPLDVFRGHIYQEERRQKEKAYWQKRRNDKARKDHERFMENL